MKSLWILLLVSSLAARSGFCTENDNAEEKSTIFSVQLGMSTDQFSSFSGYLSAKKHFTSDRAIKVGIDAWSFRLKPFYINADVSAVYLFYLKPIFPMPKGKLYFYFGIGPAFSCYYSQSTDYRRIEIGIDLPVGIEWFVFDWLSIIAEYAPPIRIGRANDTYPIVEGNYRNYLSFNLGLLNFGLLIYF